MKRFIMEDILEKYKFLYLTNLRVTPSQLKEILGDSQYWYRGYLLKCVPHDIRTYI